MGEFNKDGQIKINFESAESAETLKRVLSEIIKTYPLVEKIIEGRISYDGEYFIIDNKQDKKMTKEDLESFISEMNKFEEEKLVQIKERKTVAEMYHVLDEETIYKDTQGIWRFIESNKSVEEWNKLYEQEDDWRNK